MDSDVDVIVCEMRRCNLGCGPRRIEFELRKRNLDHIPSRSGIYRAIKRANLIDPHVRRRGDEKFRRWERAAPMGIWQFDVVGGIHLKDLSELKCLTGIDDHSRFVVSAGLMHRANSRSVCDHL